MKTTITAADTQQLLKSIREDLNVRVLEPGENPRMSFSHICLLTKSHVCHSVIFV